MIRKIEKEILKLEVSLQQKKSKRTELDDEISLVSARLKELTNIKKQYDSLELGATELLKKYKN